MESSSSVVMRESGWRRRPDGSYDSRPLDPKYAIKYYHANKERNLVDTPCPHCGKVLKNRAQMRKHKYLKTKHCQLTEKLNSLYISLPPPLENVNEAN